MSDLSRTTASVGAIRPKRFFDSVKLWNGGEGLFEKSSFPANVIKLSLPFWGRWHAKHDGEGRFPRNIALSPAYSGSSPKGRAFSFC